MSRKTMLVLALALLSLAPGAFAITFGVPDGGDHPNVGGVVVDIDGEKFLVCTGTLISPTVFLTAAHCIFDGDYFVSFDAEITASSKLHPGTPFVHPDFTFSQNDPHDVAVIVFAKSVKGITPAALPSAGLLNNLNLNGQKFTGVGYGLHERVHTPGGGAPLFEDNNERWRSVSDFNALSSAWLRLSQNPATGNGGTCFGDSGGPNFLGAGNSETPIIAALTITGDAVCRATNVTYRLDTPQARSFLGVFVTLP
ncbi:MAG TPA: trypsin-like serine protease [Thermoanaerobaculia bacterium]|nr:trypsin-like serine protease [Thermoanaerobaculia bacterium]